MALRYERRHLSFRTWFLKRPHGKGSGVVPVGDCCILLETGAPNHILLEDGSGCIEPEDCPAPDVGCCILLQDDPGDGSLVILVEDDTDGTSCVEPEDCGEPPSGDVFLLLGGMSDEFLLLDGVSDEFLLLS